MAKRLMDIITELQANIIPVCRGKITSTENFHLSCNFLKTTNKLYQRRRDPVTDPVLVGGGCY